MSRYSVRPQFSKDTSSVNGFLNEKKNLLSELIGSRKKLTVVIISAVLLTLTIGAGVYRNNTRTNASGGSVKQKIERQFDFPAINGQGQTDGSRLVLRVIDAEITDQVIVKDQTFVAKNNKIFLIVNLSLKNDTASPLNIIPGDLIRLTYNNNENDRYAPDLHNNLVLVSPLSTKLDRVGFVIPKQVKSVNLYFGELTGNKERVHIQFPS